jgi:predicted Zn-ribbon and HTH transcriptional regulator
MNSTKEKFLQTLAISDEGIEMMLQRVRRLNPGLSESEIIKILRKELKVLKDKGLPKHLKPVHNV